MSNTKGHNRSNNRVQVENLQQQERELKNHEAESIKGGGAAMGGVDRRGNRAIQRPIGEEIPS